MEVILFNLLEQSPVIIFVTIFLGLPIVLCVVIYFMWKLLRKEEKQAMAERKAHKKELKELNESKEIELKDFQKILREQDSENRETLQTLIHTLESLKSLISKKI